jgi:hypothetical protein
LFNRPAAHGYNSIAGFNITESYAVSSTGSDIMLTIGSLPWFMTYDNDKHGGVRSFTMMTKTEDSGPCASHLIVTR